MQKQDAFPVEANVSENKDSAENIGVKISQNLGYSHELKDSTNEFKAEPMSNVSIIRSQVLPLNKVSSEATTEGVN